MKEGWTYKTLGQLSSITAGQGAPQGEDNYCHDGTPFIKAANLVDLVKGYSEYSFQQVSDQTAKKYRLKLFRAGSVIFAKSGMSCMKGWVYVLKNDCYVVSHLAVVSPNGINSRFLHYYLQFSRPNSLVKDAAFPSISLKDIENLIVPDLPKEEQEEIVERLDAAFAQIDELKSNAERQLAEARALFQSALTQAMQPKPGWQDFSFSQIIKLKSGDNLPAKSFVEGAYPVYGGNGIAGYHNQYNKEGGQIVIGRVGALCGNVRFIESPFWLTDNGFEVILNKEQKMDLLFLTYLLNFCNLRQYARQAAQPVISNVSLKDIQLSIPPIKEQQNIVEHLGALSNHVKELEEINRRTAAECDAMKQALLRQIFE